MTFQRVEFACAVAIFAAIVILVGIASVARSFGSPIIWSLEISQLLFAWLVMLSADLALQLNRHFTLGLLLDNLPPRPRWIIQLVNMLIVLVLVVFLFFYSVGNTILMHPRLVGATQFHASLIHAAMPVGLALLTRTQLVLIWRHLKLRTFA
jgi:TRAP-type transport system small permease protein